MSQPLPAQRLRRSWLPIASLAVLFSFACADSSPETILEDASKEFSEAMEELRLADESVEALRGQMRKLEDELADAERVRREASKHVKEAEARLSEVADDDTLFRSVQRRLLEDAELAQTAVSAEVENRIVTLRGEVGSQEAVDRAVEVAGSAPGVASVVNELSVVGASASPAAE